MSICTDSDLLILYLLENIIQKEDLDNFQKDRVLNVLTDINDKKYSTANHINYALRILNKSCSWESFNHWKTVRELRLIREHEEKIELSYLSACL